MEWGPPCAFGCTGWGCRIWPESVGRSPASSTHDSVDTATADPGGGRRPGFPARHRRLGANLPRRAGRRSVQRHVVRVSQPARDGDRMSRLRRPRLLARPQAAVAGTLSLVAERGITRDGARGAPVATADHGRRPVGPRRRASVAPRAHGVTGLLRSTPRFATLPRRGRPPVSRARDHADRSRDDSHADRVAGGPESTGLIAAAVCALALAATEWRPLRCDLPRPVALAASGGPHRAAPAAVDDAQTVAATHDRPAGADRHVAPGDDARGARPSDGTPSAAHAG